MKENLQKSQQKQKEHYDCASKEKRYTEGDRVWLYTPVTKPGLSAKLTHHWHGPYEIVRCDLQTKRPRSQIKDFNVTCKQNEKLRQSERPPRRSRL